MKNELTPLVRSSRNNPTEAEYYLWFQLREKKLGVKFRRQTIINRYIVDFLCYEKKLIIEVDGGHHRNNQNDKIRDELLQREGFTVLRFWNSEVLEEIDRVVGRIREFL